MLRCIWPAANRIRSSDLTLWAWPMSDHFFGLAERCKEQATLQRGCDLQAFERQRAAQAVIRSAVTAIMPMRESGRLSQRGSGQ
jgi:hypothetical protein